jgi:hypothetical protein
MRIHIDALMSIHKPALPPERGILENVDSYHDEPATAQFDQRQRNVTTNGSRHLHAASRLRIRHKPLFQIANKLSEADPQLLGQA